MSQSERRYVQRAWPLLASLREALRTERNVRVALLFGSRARGTDTPASDIDLLVHLHDARLEHVVDLGARLSAVVGRRVDLVRLPDAEADPSFLADVVAEARVLVDRDGLWPGLRRREPHLRRRGRQRDSSRVDAALSGVDRLTGAAS
jgi:predicted nucleotidyltransferase